MCVRSLILYLGYLGHISNPSTPGVMLHPDRLPSYPPQLSQPPTVEEFAASTLWWEHDNVVSHILTTRLTPSVLSILPFDDDNNGMNPRTARTVYELLRRLYSVHDHTSSSALYTELCNLQCGNRVQEYVTKWRGGITQLRAAQFVISYRIVIEQFLDRLPTSVPYQILQFRIMETIDTISVDDVATFIRISDDVLNIDNVYHRAPPTTRPSPRVPTSTSTTTPSSTAQAPSTKPPCSSLICTNSNCGAIGHLIDTCFKVGGGLEGKREQYMVSKGRVQAHLAHLADILDGNSEDDPGLPPGTSDPVEQNPPFELDVDIPTLAALSITPSTIPTPVDTQINEDFVFEDYFLSPHVRCSYALSTLSSLLDPTLLSTPVSFAASTPFPYNSLLDSGCTNHIFHDKSLFWTYNSALATLVKTANCGFLKTFGRGSVHFRVQSGGRSGTFILNDCLDAPDAPINLLSVGALQEKGVTFTFSPGTTSISFPPPASRPETPAFSFFIACLS